MRAATGTDGESRAQVHVCTIFDDARDFRAEAVAFLADGLTRGERVQYLAPDDPDTARGHLAALFALPQAGRPGAVEIVSIGDAAATTARVDPTAQVAVCAAATRRAVADGFTGFRAAADSTGLVRTPEQLEAFARFEHLADRYMTGAPFSGMCGFQQTVLGDDAVAQLACLHPAGGAEQAPFRLHAVRGADVAVSGELDLTTVDLFATTLRHAGLGDATTDFVIDATDLAFADHRNLLVLELLARRHGRSVVLRTSRRWPERLVGALELTRVRIERVA